MKKIATLLLAAGLLLGGTTAAQAIEIKPTGGMEFQFNFGKQTLDKTKPAAYGTGATKAHSFYQRNRVWFDVIASEALKGTFGFENNLTWGKSAVTPSGSGSGNGGGIGSRGVNVELLHAYIDWIVPSTDLKVRMGMQSFANPTFVNNSPMVVGDHMAGIVASNQFTPNVGLVGFYFRPYNENTASYGGTSKDGVIQRRYNTVDMFGVAVPLTFNGVTIVPWGAYGALGRDSATTGGRSNWALPDYTLPVWGVNALTGGFGTVEKLPDGQGNGWWLGLTGELTMWNPLRLAFDFNYGSTDFGSMKINNGVDPAFSVDCKRTGWYAAVLAEYKLDFATPGLTLWYASGDDDKVDNGSEMMPAVRPSAKYTTFGNDSWSYNAASGATSYGLQGTWGVMAQLKDLSFTKDLKHNVRVMYSRGTNDPKMVENGIVDSIRGAMPAGAGSGFLYLTDKDSAWEVNVDSYYDIYKNLQLGLELGYIKLSIDKDVWGKGVKDKVDNGYKAAIVMRYLF
jgi:hypothetical protein